MIKPILLTALLIASSSIAKTTDEMADAEHQKDGTIAFLIADLCKPNDEVCAKAVAGTAEQLFMLGRYWQYHADIQH